MRAILAAFMRWHRAGAFYALFTRDNRLRVRVISQHLCRDMQARDKAPECLLRFESRLLSIGTPGRNEPTAIASRYARTPTSGRRSVASLHESVVAVVKCRVVQFFGLRPWCWPLTAPVARCFNPTTLSASCCEEARQADGYNADAGARGTMVCYAPDTPPLCL